MKRPAIFPVLLLLLQLPLYGQSVKLPTEVKGDVGSFIKIPADTDGKEVRWYSPDKGLQVFPVELLKDSKTAVVTANAPGRYRLVAWSAKGDIPSDPALCVVVIGEAPPGPDPGPGPGPTPTDPLTKEYQSAYDKEPDSDKKELLKAWLAVYRQASSDAEAPEVKTWKDLQTVVGKVADSLGCRGKLTGVQAVSQGALKAVFPSDPAREMTQDDRKIAANTFKRLAAALEGVK